MPYFWGMKYPFVETHLQDEIQAALTLLPDNIEPGYTGELDFSELCTQISKLEQQHLVLSLYSWISHNAGWLQTHGLQLHRSWLQDGAHSLIMTYGHFAERERLFRQAGLPVSELPAIGALLHCLNRVSSGNTWPSIVELVCDLNAVRWHPQEAEAVLMEALEDVMGDAEGWLMSHQAYAQSSALQHLTPPALADRVRGRL